MQATKNIIVLYDGIQIWLFKNSGTSILHDLGSDIQHSLHIITFEYSKNKALENFPQHPNLELTILPKKIFLGRINLLRASKHLKKIISSYSAYSLTTDGPCAAFICLKAIDWQLCTRLTVQSNTIAAHSYEHAHQHEKNILKRWWHSFITYQLKKIESTVYSHTQKSSKLIVHAKSLALKEFLFNTYKANPLQITIDEELLPILDKSIVDTWRVASRQELCIDQAAYVYCFKGNYDAAENPDFCLNFFKQKLKEEPHAYLLVLTPHKDLFEIAARHHHIPFESYQIKIITSQDSYRYLAACDAGIIFRDMHIIHWVSKPDVAIEYKAVGLEIIHNNTIAWIAKENSQHNNNVMSWQAKQLQDTVIEK